MKHILARAFLALMVTTGSNAVSQSRLRHELPQAPLFRAMTEGDCQLVKELILHGADINARDNVGSTLLHYAVKYKDIAFIEWLLAHGADVAIKNDAGYTPFFSRFFLKLRAEDGEMMQKMEVLLQGAMR